MTDETKRWSVRKLAILFYPFTAAAVAINVFFIGLLGQALDLSIISPLTSILVAVPLGMPASWLVARWVRGLMDQADPPRPS